MWKPTLWWLVLIASALFILDDNWVLADDYDFIHQRNEAELLNKIHALGRRFASKSRARDKYLIDTPETNNELNYGAVLNPKVQRAMSMLTLQTLDKLYANRARPRFGKRGMEKNLNNEDFSKSNLRQNVDEDWFPEER